MLRRIGPSSLTVNQRSVPLNLARRTRSRKLVVGLVVAVFAFSAFGVAQSTSIDPDILWEHADHPDPSVHLQRLSDFTILFPFHPNVSSAISMLLDGSRQLQCVDALRLLDVVEAVLQKNPVRPVWHVYAARAQTRWGPGTADLGCPTNSPLVYIKLLRQVIDATKPDEFYVRHPYDAEAATLVPGLDIPIFSSTWDTSFLRAVINKVAGEPIHAQLLKSL